MQKRLKRSRSGLVAVARHKQPPCALDGGAHWRHLAHTMDRSVSGTGGKLCKNNRNGDLTCGAQKSCIRWGCTPWRFPLNESARRRCGFMSNYFGLVHFRGQFFWGGVIFWPAQSPRLFRSRYSQPCSQGDNSDVSLLQQHVKSNGFSRRNLNLENFATVRRSLPRVVNLRWTLDVIN